MRIRTLIIDDEPLARERLRRMLGGEADIEIAGECGDGAKAVRLIRETVPDFIFLDIQMPEMSGFEVLESITPQCFPEVVFVTAYDRYALKAFEIHALDYLLKPVNQQRVKQSLQRVREQLAKNDLRQRIDNLTSLLESLGEKKTYLEKFTLKSAGKVYFLKTEEVDRIEAAGNYVKLHTGKSYHMLRETMNTVESKLDPQQFSRIHRSTIINVKSIKELHPLFNGDYTLILKDETQLVLSRKYRHRLFD